MALSEDKGCYTMVVFIVLTLWYQEMKLTIDPFPALQIMMSSGSLIRIDYMAVVQVIVSLHRGRPCVITSLLAAATLSNCRYWYVYVWHWWWGDRWLCALVLSDSVLAGWWHCARVIGDCWLVEVSGLMAKEPNHAWASGTEVIGKYNFPGSAAHVSYTHTHTHTHTHIHTHTHTYTPKRSRYHIYSLHI